MQTSKKRATQAGLGLSLNTSTSAFKQRATFVAANTPSVNGDEAQEPDMLNGENGSGSSTFAGGIRENQYSNDEDGNDNESDMIYYDGNTSMASTSSSAASSRPGTSTSTSTTAGYKDINATPTIRQMGNSTSTALPGSGFSTPLLGTFSHNVDSTTLPPSPRSPSFYRDKDDLSFEDPALRYGGLHVNTNNNNINEKMSSTTSLLNGLGVSYGKNGNNRSTSSIVNMPSSPALGGGINSSSSSSSPRDSGRGGGGGNGPTSGWRAIITGRKKIHPLALGPAFLLGVILAASGIFSSSDPAATARCVFTTLTPAWPFRLKSFCDRLPTVHGHLQYQPHSLLPL